MITTSWIIPQCAEDFEALAEGKKTCILYGAKHPEGALRVGDVVKLVNVEDPEKFIYRKVVHTSLACPKDSSLVQRIVASVQELEDMKDGVHSKTDPSPQATEKELRRELVEVSTAFDAATYLVGFYRNLIGDKLKQFTNLLNEARTLIDHLEEDNKRLEEDNKTLKSECNAARRDRDAAETLSRQFAGLLLDVAKLVKKWPTGTRDKVRETLKSEFGEKGVSDLFDDKGRKGKRAKAS